MERKQNKMGYAPVTPLLLSMAFPPMISMLIQALYNIVDSIFVAQISSQALSAISLAFPIQSLMIAIFVGTNVGLNSLISRRLGEQRHSDANDAAAHGLIISVLSGIFIALVGLLGTRPFFLMMTDNQEIIELGCTYTMIVTGVCMFNSIQCCVEKMLQSTGNMVAPMVSHVIGCVVNIILDPILIFGWFGIPAMGITGAAIATVTGQACGMIFCIVMFIKTNKILKVSFKGFRFKGSIIKDIYQVGFPSIVMQSIGAVLTTLMNMILINFSEAAVNVLGIYYKLQQFILMPTLGVTQGAMPIVGYNFGAGNKKRIMKTIKMALIFGIGIMCIGLILFQVFPQTLLSMFNADAETLAIGIPALRIVSLSFIPTGYAIVMGTNFQAVGRGFTSLIISLCRQLIVLLPVAYLMSKISLNAVWAAFPIAEFFAAILVSFLFLNLYRKVISKLVPIEER